MLQLKNICKTYFIGENHVDALKNIDIELGNSGFVSILGPSGCGKTTLLNIIGGLDQYSSGDLIINGISTKSYSNTNWDNYRNATVGFIFQSFNLISHLNVLENVEIALSLSGVSKKQRIERAKEVLSEVGLENHLHHLPNQLSGGQMQRVAIARALVNNPKILLADEPTGSLDTKTSAQIIKIMKEISKDRLVIMVTHNTVLAQRYSDRIIKLLDGEIISSLEETDRFSVNQSCTKNLTNMKSSMSFSQAIKTSFKSLFAKKGRTIITTIAGSIGIIGIAIVLGLSHGLTQYMNDIQTNTLSGFPITINKQTMSFTSNIDAYTNEGEFPSQPIIYTYDSDESSIAHTNIISDEFLTYLENMDQNLVLNISYTNEMILHIIYKSVDDQYHLIETAVSSGISYTQASSDFNELPSNQTFVESQYEILAGTYPSNYSEVALIIDKNNQLDVSFFEKIGISLEDNYSFDDFLGMTFKVIPNNQYYQTNDDITYSITNDYESMYQSQNAITFSISAIMRINEEAQTELIPAGIAYTNQLTQVLLDLNMQSHIVQAQKENTDINVLTGVPFNSIVTYEDTIGMIGGKSTPASIQIYPSSYQAKESIKTYLNAYNINQNDEHFIVYDDLAEVLSSTVSSLISTISIVLIGFASISLVVSSIMIGIITYVSVIERTKEIGIMRAIGARQKDISRIFNAETIIIGFGCGLLGVLLYYGLQLLINRIVGSLLGIQHITALPLYYATALIVLSCLLTLVAGYIPSRIAAKKDPVVALRTE